MMVTMGVMIGRGDEYNDLSESMNDPYFFIIECYFSCLARLFALKSFLHFIDRIEYTKYKYRNIYIYIYTSGQYHL